MTEREDGLALPVDTVQARKGKCSDGRHCECYGPRTNPCELTYCCLQAPSPPADLQPSTSTRTTPREHAARAFAPEDVPVPPVNLRGPLIPTPDTLDPVSPRLSPEPSSPPQPPTGPPATNELPAPSPPLETVQPQGEIAAAGVEIVLGEDEQQDAAAWQRERIERKLRGEYERAGRHLAEIVRPLHSLQNYDRLTPTRAGQRQLGCSPPPQRHPHPRRTFDSPVFPLSHLRPLPRTPPASLFPRSYLFSRLVRACSPLKTDSAFSPAGDAGFDGHAGEVRYLSGYRGEFGTERQRVEREGGCRHRLAGEGGAQVFLADIDGCGRRRGECCESPLLPSCLTLAHSAVYVQSATAKIRNAFGGAETIEGNVSFGTRTKSAFQVRLVHSAGRGIPADLGRAGQTGHSGQLFYDDACRPERLFRTTGPQLLRQLSRGDEGRDGAVAGAFSPFVARTLLR